MYFLGSDTENLFDFLPTFCARPRSHHIGNATRLLRLIIIHEPELSQVDARLHILIAMMSSWCLKFKQFLFALPFIFVLR